MRPKRFIVDIDGTICSKVTDFPSNYKTTEPFRDRIAYFNELYNSGYEIIYWTSRGQTSGIDWTEFTKAQLAEWGVLYTELWMNKPMYDYWIDDKAENADDFGNRLEGLSWAQFSQKARSGGI